MKKSYYPFLFFLFIFALFLLCTSCQFKTFQQIPSETSALVIANVKESSISFVNPDSGTQVAKWKLDFPFNRVMLMPDRSTLLIYGKNNANATLINMTTGRQVGQWKVGEGIVNAVLSSDEKSIYLADKNQNLVFIYDLNGNVKGKIPVGESPFTMIPSPDEKQLYVFHLNGASLSVIDLQTQKVKTTLATNPSPMGGLYISQRDEIWVGGHGVGDVPEKTISIFSLQDGKKKGEISAPLMPVDFIQFDKNTAFVLSHGTNMLYRLDISTGKETGKMQLGANPFGLASDKNKLYVSSYDSNQVFVVDPQSLKVLRTFNVGSGPLQIVLREGVGQ